MIAKASARWCARMNYSASIWMNICRLRRSPSVPQGAAIFELAAIDKSTKARRGHLQTAHGKIDTRPSCRWELKET